MDGRPRVYHSMPSAYKNELSPFPASLDPDVSGENVLGAAVVVGAWVVVEVVVVVAATVVLLSVVLLAGAGVVMTAGVVVGGTAVVVEIPTKVPFTTYPNRPEVWKRIQILNREYSASL